MSTTILYKEKNPDTGMRGESILRGPCYNNYVLLGTAWRISSLATCMGCFNTFRTDLKKMLLLQRHRAPQVPRSIYL